MNKMDELKAAVEKIGEILGYGVDQIQITLKPSQEQDQPQPSGRYLDHYFTKYAAGRIDEELKEIGFTLWTAHDLNDNTNSNNYHNSSPVSGISIQTIYKIQDTDRIAQLEAELAKLREQEAIQ